MYYHGSVRELTVRTRTWNGTKRVLYVRGSSWYGRPLGCCPCRCVRGRNTVLGDVYATDPSDRWFQDDHDQLNPHRPEDSHRRRYRYVPGNHWSQRDGLDYGRWSHTG